mgnify:CR=1 FL=1
MKALLPWPIFHQYNPRLMSLNSLIKLKEIQQEHLKNVEVPDIQHLLNFAQVFFFFFFFFFFKKQIFFFFFF